MVVATTAVPPRPHLEAFFSRVDPLRGRLIFAIDATASRQPTWDLALGLQADMFRAVKEVGGLDVQLVYFRGFGETRASKWVSDPEALARLPPESVLGLPHPTTRSSTGA